MCITALGMTLLMSASVRSEPLSFPDPGGKVVEKGEDYIVRLIDTPGSRIKTAEALFLVQASPEACNNIITDFEHYPEFMPNIVNTRLLISTADSSTYHFTLKVAMVDINYTLLLKGSVQGDMYGLTWDYVAGDIRSTTGSWDIRREGIREGYSRIRYIVHTDPGKFVPGWVANKLSTESIPEMIVAIRERTSGSRQGTSSN